MSEITTARHAIYFAPPLQHPLWELGCRWLGRDVDGISAAGGPTHTLVAEPWRYGFHATLKAPMKLAEGIHESEWLDAVCALAARHRQFPMPPLQVAMLSDFMALRPVEPVHKDHALRRLADDGVLFLDRWRNKRATNERADSNRPMLDERLRSQGERFGYPFVFDDWRFHMTLSSGLTGVDAEHIDALRDAATRHFAPVLRAPWICESLCVFVEPNPGQAFELRHRVALGQS